MSGRPAELALRLGSEAPWGAQLRDYLHAGRTRVRALHAAGSSGGQVAAAWTDRCDAAVTAVFGAVQAQHRGLGEGIAVVALGEYGDGCLSPYAALELVVLHRPEIDPGPLLESVLRPLWEARLDVQGVARTVDAHRQFAATDTNGLGDLLAARWVCGEAGLAERLLGPERDVGTGPERAALVARGLEEMHRRHTRYGDTVYLLEPHLVEGQGGLRDIYTALWAARCHFGAATADRLLRPGEVPASELRGLEECREFLLRLRHQLHFLSGRREDRLSFERQDDAARFFAFADTAERSGAEALLQEYYACANRVEQFVGSLVRRSQPGRTHPGAPSREVSPGVWLRGGELFLDARTTAENPLQILAAFEAAQTHDAVFSPQALAVVRDNLVQVDDRFRRDPEAVALFLRVLQHPRRVATTLMRMHDVRFLDRFIPELAHTFGRVQRDPYHAYPVDIHSLFAVQELRRLARGEYREEFPQYTQVMAELERPHLVYLAALLHDVGKGYGSHHEERGAELAIQVADRMDLPPRERADLEFLVREHLSLALTAQSRDLHDEQLIAAFAAHTDDPQLLRMLHLLTFADVRAVGPTAWTSWKQLLFRELFEKALAVLERGAPPQDITGERVAAVCQRLRSAAGDLTTTAEVEAFLEHIDHPRYLLANPVAVLLRHLAAFLRRGDVPVAELREVPAEGYSELLLLARDRKGLFATVAGLLAAHQLNILSAVLNTRTDGWVVDVFHLTRAGGEPLGDGPAWELLRADLVESLSGDGVLALPERAWPHAPASTPGALPPVPARVRVDNQVSSRFTVVDLSGPDRLGLLYDVARALAEQGLQVRLAKIVTMIRRVADAFYVELEGGGKLTDPQALARLQRRLETVAGGEPQEGDHV